VHTHIRSDGGFLRNDTSSSSVIDDNIPMACHKRAIYSAYVHIDVAAAMTGVTRFGQEKSSKREVREIMAKGGKHEEGTKGDSFYMYIHVRIHAYM
jgi:hypothetical protein